MNPPSFANDSVIPSFRLPVCPSARLPVRPSARPPVCPSARPYAPEPDVVDRSGPVQHAVLYCGCSGPSTVYS